MEGGKCPNMARKEFLREKLVQFSETIFSDEPPISEAYMLFIGEQPRFGEIIILVPVPCRSPMESPMGRRTNSAPEGCKRSENRN